MRWHASATLGQPIEQTAREMIVFVGVMGLGLAAVYLWRRSLIAPVAMHFSQDCLAMVVLPLLLHQP